ncbi:uncharacterized protein J7T54_005949 [Emericellopsis cladophorae]|uniref:DUF8004 domain-containing protein n=1 Tax=Emericellopsis cladophorae TaxID=2686198 RepID=A0A9Q0BI94_9HYPO|nr:uncharacterized protein J7T54_005949 [Emericellopsis cladophorae]KAI6785615.1 hypothetical protein J7T54_005949 [Emericellopsis cladophorae]
MNKSKTWSNRLSFLMPSLITNDLDSQSGSLRRKPIVGSTKSDPPTSPSVTSPDPPPYRLHDPQSPERTGQFTSNHSLPLRHITEAQSNGSQTSSISSRPGSDSLQSLGLPPLTETPMSSAWITTEMPAHPEHAPPAPPSPRIAAVMQQDSALKTGTQRSSTSTTGSASKEGSPRQKLHKELPENRSRRNSLKSSSNHASLQSAIHSQPVASDQRALRSVSAQIPAPAPDPSDPRPSRVPSLPVVPSVTATPPTENAKSQSPSRGRLRRSWLPGGGRSRSNSVDVHGKGPNTPQAWVLTDGTHAEYNPLLLRNGEKVPELWNESGNILVYLYPQASGCGPSFKVMEFTVSSSYVFNELMQTDRDSLFGTRSRARSFSGRNSLTAEDAGRIRSPPSSPSVSDSNTGDMRLYLPTAPPSADSGQLAAPGEGSSEELDRLIAIRNLFAFLTGQPLVATKARPTVFKVFLQIATLLEEFGFTSPDGATFGTAVDLSFEFYIDQLGLADCRHSREKTIEALILGERMRNMDLYSEAFAHAAGKYAAIMDLKLPLYQEVNPHTRQQLERAHFDLLNRQHGVNQHIEQFEFPSLFAGLANSTSIPELRHVRFKVWRNSFNKLRSFVLSHYKSTFGNWPPKASSSKNPFAESGLNRLVLKMLYSDMCALYDLLVDRDHLTSRIMDEVPAISKEPGKMTTSALRNIMSEFDRSKPPVLPPVPFDLPQLPSMSSVLETYPTLSAKDQIKFDKGIKEHELILILNKAYNYDANTVKLPFLEKFKEFELREAKGKMAPDLYDQRMGYWLFLYVVIQSLPMLVVDAPGLKFTEGSEYFLCQPPMGNPPWIEDRQVKKMWYEVAGGGGLVQLSTDAVLFSVEATYHRSHCWLAAKKWQGLADPELSMEDPGLPVLEPPPPMPQDDVMGSGPPSVVGGTSTPPGSVASPPVTLLPRNLSPGGPGGGRTSRASRASQAYRSSVALGLEPVPMEPPSLFGGGNHARSSSYGPRPMSSMLGSRTRSHGNLVGAFQSSQLGSPTSDPQDDPNTGATFDDILGQPEKKSTKKKFFF